MPISCRYKVEHGTQFCVTDCPAASPCGVFRYARVEHPEDVPPVDEMAIDVAVLDMNHGWPNLGHDSLVHAVLDQGCDLLPVFRETGLHVRVLSFDVRRSAIIPEPPGGRFSLYLGTGGPGHLDPRRNDGVSVGAQGLTEDARWETPFFSLLDRIQEDDGAALLGVCHTFGVLCRWSGAARPTLRGEEKGGKRSGVLENVLTPEAGIHPWFRRFAEELPDHRHLRVVENRLFDLVPDDATFSGSIVPIGREGDGDGGSGAQPVTMLEFARDRKGVMPRVFGVNHHPEIVDRERQRMILEQKRERGEVTPTFYSERLEALTRNYPDENSDQRLHLTSDYTLLAPLRFHVQRALRTRAEDLGLSVDVHEDRLLEAAGVA
jgi:hypothetical protein